MQKRITIFDTVYLAARLILLRERVHIKPAINKNTQLMLARQMS